MADAGIFQNATAQPFFPTFAWIHDLRPELHEALDPRLAQALEALTAPRPKLDPGRNWQTGQTLHEREDFAELVGIIRLAVKQVLDVLEVDYQDFEITACWANMNPSGAAHPPHTHPNNYLSGVYCVQAPPGGDSLSFDDPRPQVDILAPPVKRQNACNATIHNIRVQPGRLVVFPARFVHSVQPHGGQGLRISISFNVMFPGFDETMSRAKWTGIPLRRRGGP